MLTLTAHAAADGGMPDPSLTVVVAGVFGWMSSATARRAPGGDRRRGRTGRQTAGILTKLAVAQLFMHSTLTLCESDHGATSGVAVDPVVMLAAHAAATLLIAVLICGAEHALLAVVAGLRRLLPVVVLAGPHPPARPALVTAPVVAGQHVEVVLRRVNARRGPPLFS